MAKKKNAPTGDTETARDAKRDKLKIRMEVRQHILDKVSAITKSSAFSPEAKAMFAEEHARLFRKLTTNYGHGTTHAV